MNSRVWYNGLTPKEILFRRDAFTNQEKDVNASVISKKQLNNRHTSSKYSQKSKMSSEALTPVQKFCICDVVFIRDQISKTSPRDLYNIQETVQELEKKFFFIRKLNHSLQSHLSKALPVELIKAPQKTH